MSTEIEFVDDIEKKEIENLLETTPEDVDTAKRVTFSKNYFFPLTTACRYTCSYCTFFDPPGKEKIISLDEVKKQSKNAAKAGCTEALFVTGDKPDSRYQETLYDTLSSWGFDSFISYIYKACEVSLDQGLLPHTNIGYLSVDEMKTLKEVNSSMGLMLETTAKLDVHSGPRHKTPEERIQAIETAGKLKIPFTTGLLIGIGENWEDRAESLLTIKKLHEKYGHIQEVIIQNVMPNKRWDNGSPSIETMRKVVAMARKTLPEEVSVQAPPNIAPVEDLLDCGIDDLGGVSPVTKDFVNPDYDWPEITELEEITEKSELELKERLPVYTRYLDWMPEKILKKTKQNFPEYL